MKYLNKTQIRALILQTCQQPKTLTEILSEIKRIGGRYCQIAKQLEKAGLLQKDGRKYVVTGKGQEWLKHYEALQKLEGRE